MYHVTFRLQNVDCVVAVRVPSYNKGKGGIREGRGMQRILYKMEHSFVLLISIYIYSLYGISWLWFLLYLAVPDVVCLLPVMLLKNERAYKEIQRHLYEFSHSYAIVILLGLTIYLLTDFIVCPSWDGLCILHWIELSAIIE